MRIHLLLLLLCPILSDLGEAEGQEGGGGRLLWPLFLQEVMGGTPGWAGQNRPKSARFKMI